jgi:hypothetical protein
VWQALAEQVAESGVGFKGQDVRALGEEEFGEGAEAGADFEHAIPGSDPGGVDDSLELMGVVQEILAERTGEAQVVLFQDPADFAERHGQGGDRFADL